MPEFSILEIWEDVEGHWDWMHSILPELLEKETNGEIQADLGRILAIRAVNAVYPMTNPKVPCSIAEQLRPVFNIPILPEDALERHLENMKEQEALAKSPIVRSAESSPKRLELNFPMCHHG
ncbi:hypothetical protein SI65_00668 [Aspergillus cristatus]|uniref:Uncharacterized protein n=1 Tax=Aspergillus cristatus TaxID=573508 RepID=A0A1E3BQ55_ASPCR|nr:hypothetical protein SI65_00668 [Aspergillus cristatus]